LTIQLPTNAPLLSASGRAIPLGLRDNCLALSPDGQWLVYIAEVGSTAQLYLRALNRFEAKPIAGTEGAFGVFFSPHGQMIGFFAQNELRKISLQGGAPVTICEARNIYAATWTEADQIYFTDDSRNLWRVPAGGGQGELLTNLTWVSQHSAPSREHITLSYSEGAINADYNMVSVFSPRTRSFKDLGERGYAPQILSAGYLLLARRGTLMAAPIDLDRLNLTGPAVPVVEDVLMDATEAQFSVSDNGSLVYVSGGALDHTVPVWVDRQGKSDPLPMPAQNYGTFKLSPDGRHLAIVVATATDDIWIYETETGKPRRLTFEGINICPIWMPDGTRLIFGSRLGRQCKLLLKPLVGGETQALYATDKPVYPFCCSPDGRQVLFNDSEFHRIYALVLDGTNQPQMIVASKFAAWGPSFSPDGRWIGYTAEDSGRYEVYVQAYPSGQRTQVSFQGGEEPIWSPKGDELFYRNGDKWLSVPISTEGGFKPGTPRELFRGPYWNIAGVSYDIARDGRRFLLLKPVHQEEPVTELKVVLNWFEELKTRVPGGPQAK